MHLTALSFNRIKPFITLSKLSDRDQFDIIFEKTREKDICYYCLLVRAMEIFKMCAIDIATQLISLKCKKNGNGAEEME